MSLAAEIRQEATRATPGSDCRSARRAGPLIYRKSIIKAAGFDKVPEDHAGLLDLCQKLQKAGKPAGFALGNAVGDGNGFANWLLWSHNAALLDEAGNVTINSKETVAALKYLKQLYPTFIAGTPSWNDVSNNRAYSSQEISLTANGVSLYFSLKNDPATAAIAEDSEHQFLPMGVAKSPPMGGLCLNAMVFKHSPYPNAAKAFLQFMMEKEQYEPWLTANCGYWAHPLTAYTESRGVDERSQDQDLQGYHGEQNTTPDTPARSRRPAAPSTPTTCWCRCALRSRPTPLPRRPPPPKPSGARSGISEAYSGRRQNKAAVIARSEAHP